MNIKKLFSLLAIVACFAPDPEVAAILGQRHFLPCHRDDIPDRFADDASFPDPEDGDEYYLRDGDSLVTMNGERFSMVCGIGDVSFKIDDPFGHIHRAGLHKAAFFEQFIRENIGAVPKYFDLSHLFILFTFTEQQRNAVFAGPFWNIFDFTIPDLYEFPQYREVVAEYGKAFIEKARVAEIIDETEYDASRRFHGQVLSKMDEIAAFVGESTEFFPIFMSLSFGQSISEQYIDNFVFLNDGTRKGHKYISIRYDQIPQYAESNGELAAFHDLLERFEIGEDQKKPFKEYVYYILKPYAKH